MFMYDALFENNVVKMYMLSFIGRYVGLTDVDVDGDGDAGMDMDMDVHVHSTDTA